MILKKTSFENVKEIHKSIFNENLIEGKVSEKQKTGGIIFYHLLENEEVVGYVSLQSREKTCHIWMTGLLPQFRGKKLGKKLYFCIEEYAKKSGFFRISLSTHNDNREMLALAIRNNYRIIKTDKGEYGDNIKIRLEKQINSKNELRLLLTEICNYKCFFCHSEGIDAKGDYSKSSKEKIFQRLAEGIELGYNDITLTGGEPLIRYKDIIYLLNEINKFETLPKITIVTNGLLINKEIITAILNYKGDFKFNISLHSIDAEKYALITKVKSDNYFKVIENIKLLTNEGIKVKLNSVILKNYNTDANYLKKFLRTAHELGVNSVKFLELLIIKENEAYFKDFYSAETICRKLEKMSCKEEQKMIRGTIYSHPEYSNLNIEVIKCTCKLGCSNCMDVRDRTFGPDLNYYPCFIQSKNPVTINEKRAMKSAFEKGNRIINSYAVKYKSDSPILIAQDNYLRSRSEMFYKTNLSFEECNNILANKGFIHSKTRVFSLYYYHPKSAGSNWINFNKILKFGYDSHTPNKIEFIYSDHKYSRIKNKLFLSEQRFLKDLLPPYCSSLEQAEEIMGALDFKKYFEFDYEFVDFKRNDILISLDRKSKSVNFKIKYQDLSSEMWKNLLVGLKAEMIDEPFTKWFIDNNRNYIINS